jgi:predicted enzyme related to lactoylglutathione lyase
MCRPTSAASRRLARFGIREPYTVEEAPGSWIATFADPDDSYFQLMTPMEPNPAG